MTRRLSLIHISRRNERIHLRVDGGGNILPVDGDGLPFLQHLTEQLGDVYKRQLQYMVNYKLGYKLLLSDILPQFEDIKNRIGVTDEVFIEHLAEWNTDLDKYIRCV